MLRPLSRGTDVKLRALLIALSACWYSHLSVAGPSAVHVVDKHGKNLEYVAIVVPDRVAVDSKPKQLYVLDQINKQFVPPVLVVHINGLVNFPNTDDTRHHIYSFSEAKTFELRLDHAGEADPVMFDKPGIVKIGCNIHNNMRAYILVTEDTVFGTTDAKGRYAWPQLNRVPTQLQVWHPQLTNIMRVDVDPNADIVEVSLPVDQVQTPPPEGQSGLEDRLRRYKRNAQ